MSFPIINLLLLITGFVGLAGLYLFSLQPQKREAKIGVKAWKESKNIRTIAFFFEFLGMTNIILWYWFPVETFNWKITQNSLSALIVSIILGVPLLSIMMISLIQAGKESWEPSKETKLHGGLYKYVRHPQAITEFPFFIVMGLGVNSWFLVILLTFYNIIFLPLMLRIEEKDLIRRFGDKYIEYQQKVPPFFPKIRKKEKN